MINIPNISGSSFHEDSSEIISAENCRIVRAKNDTALFAGALDFLVPYEKFCCSLAEEIIKKSDGLYIILSDDQISGAFSISPGGTLLLCLPQKNKDIRNTLCDFLRTKKISCINAEKSQAEFVADLIQNNPTCKEDYYLFHYSKKTYISPNSAHNSNIIICQPSDAQNLMPLQLEYIKEEVLPQGISSPGQLNPAAVRLGLDRLIKNSRILACTIADSRDRFHNSQFCAKLHFTAEGMNFMQIGGVYTKPEFRQKHIAESLMEEAKKIASVKEKNLVLYVKKNNLGALNLYRSSGFELTGEYSTVYFRQN